MSSVAMPLPRRWPRQCTVGLGLIALAWPLAWSHWEPISRYTFFPLWLGYILTMDGLVLIRRGSSILSQSPRRWTLLFVLSMPFWWAFELLNLAVHNWEYLGTAGYGFWSYLALASVNFSTVLPAVMESSELVASFAWLRRLRLWWPVPSTPVVLWSLLVFGVLSIILPVRFPHYAYPLVWGVLFFLVEPFNVWLGAPTLFAWLRRGDWRPVIALALGTLLCGFFWEMWNYHSFPKWIYHVPGFDQGPHLFEMPLPGFLGYLPFALELYAMMNLLHHLLGRSNKRLVRLGDDE